MICVWGAPGGSGVLENLVVVWFWEAQVCIAFGYVKLGECLAGSGSWTANAEEAEGE